MSASARESATRPITSDVESVTTLAACNTDDCAICKLNERSLQRIEVGRDWSASVSTSFFAGFGALPFTGCGFGQWEQQLLDEVRSTRRKQIGQHHLCRIARALARSLTDGKRKPSQWKAATQRLPQERSAKPGRLPVYKIGWIDDLTLCHAVGMKNAMLRSESHRRMSSSHSRASRITRYLPG